MMLNLAVLFFIVAVLAAVFGFAGIAGAAAGLAQILFVVFVILFYSPLPFPVRSIIPFGYFFLFEYSILNRNYAIGILIAFIICIIIHKNFKGKI